MSDRIRFVLGAVVLLGLISLAVAIALGKVEEKTSYGLTGVVTILGKVALDFSGWAFRLYRGDQKEPKDGVPTE